MSDTSDGAGVGNPAGGANRPPIRLLGFLVPGLVGWRRSVGRWFRGAFGSGIGCALDIRLGFCFVGGVATPYFLPPLAGRCRQRIVEALRALGAFLRTNA